MSEENLRNIGNQLIEAGQQLLEEATAKDEADLLSISKDILSKFSWTFDFEDLDEQDWYLDGQPVGPQAKSFVALGSSHHVWQKIQEQLDEEQLDEEVQLYHSNNNTQLTLNIYPAKKFLDWLKAHSHFQFTNLPEALDALAPIIEERKVEQKNLEDIAAHLTDLHRGENPPVSLDAVDWEEVDKGNQEAPLLLKKENFSKMAVGRWIYMGFRKRSTAAPRANEGCVQWGWDHSLESCQHDSDLGLSLAQATSRVHKGCPVGRTAYSTLYRNIGEGIAELVYSKNGLKG